jgi:dihydroorotase
MLPLMLNHVHHGKLSLLHLVQLLCTAPAQLYGAKRKGRIAVGYDADFSIVDLQRKHTITNASIASKVGWTPFDGMQVTGWPVITLVRGKVVMRDGAVQAAPAGKPVEFLYGT